MHNWKINEFDTISKLLWVTLMVKLSLKGSCYKINSTKIDFMKNWRIISDRIFYVQTEHEKTLAKKTFFGNLNTKEIINDSKFRETSNNITSVEQNESIYKQLKDFQHIQRTFNKYYKSLKFPRINNYKFWKWRKL